MKLTSGVFNELNKRSPSMRREWIEMDDLGDYDYVGEVSLHAEGVD